jgi:hypothetical protein
MTGPPQFLQSRFVVHGQISSTLLNLPVLFQQFTSIAGEEQPP